MLQLKSTTFSLSPSQKILKAKTYAAYVDSQSIIANANKESERIKKESLEAFEAEKKKGFEQGLAEGKAQIAQHMMDSITATIKNLESFESEVVEIVMQAVRRILGQMDNTELITRIAKNAVGLVKNQKRVVLRVNSKDAARLEHKISEMLAEFPGISFIDIVPDQRLKEGDVMLETDIGAVDARLETQLDVIRKSLTKAVQ
jgi:type III secretion protein L